MKRAVGGICFAPLPALTQTGTCTLTLPPGWKKRWVCVGGEAHSCPANGLHSRGEKSGGNCRVTYSRWTVLTAKATEGNAFCPHGRYFTQLHEEKRAEFKRELGKSQLCCLETVLSFQYIKIKSTQRQENACGGGSNLFSSSNKSRNGTAHTEIQLPSMPAAK